MKKVKTTETHHCDRCNKVITSEGDDSGGRYEMHRISYDKGGHNNDAYSIKNKINEYCTDCGSLIVKFATSESIHEFTADGLRIVVIK